MADYIDRKDAHHREKKEEVFFLLLLLLFLLIHLDMLLLQVERQRRGVLEMEAGNLGLQQQAEQLR